MEESDRLRDCNDVNQRLVNAIDQLEEEKEALEREVERLQQLVSLHQEIARLSHLGESSGAAKF